MKGRFRVPASHIASFISLLWLLEAGLLAGGATSARGQSPLDGFDPNLGGTLRVVAVQPDGKILIGGDFATLAPNGGGVVTRNNMARLNPDGTLDTAFDPNANDDVLSITVQTNGQILIGGRFTTLAPNGGSAVTRNYIARLNADGTLDAAFDPNANGMVDAIAVQANGQILAGGFFTTIGGEARNFIARLDATTGLADSFNPNASSVVEAITVQADGKILLGGSFSSIGGQPRNFIARVDATTGLADSFDPNASQAVASIAIQADGKILAAGQFLRMGEVQRHRIARLDPVDGSPDSFDPIADNAVDSIVVQADGKILVGGFFTTIGPSDRPEGEFGQIRNYIARIDPVTALPDSFNPNANDPVLAIAVQGDGKVLAGGFFTTLTPNVGVTVTRNHIARLETDGRVDQTLDLGTVGIYVAATAVQPDGKVLIGGDFNTVLGVARNSIARLNTDGTLDLAFNPNSNSDVNTLALQADGKILAGGNFFGPNSIGGQTRNRIARLDATTGLADSFDPDANNQIFSIVVQADGKILVGGIFSTIGGQTRNRIARLDAATGLADSFNPSADSGVRSIAVQTDGKILAGGLFSAIGGQTRHRIARLDATTGLADPFDPNADNEVHSIAVQVDGKILAGGLFSLIGGQTRNNIVRLEATTGLADLFDPNANGNLHSIAIQADGRILAGGAFTSIGGQPRNRIARLQAATGLADSFDPNANSAVLSITVQPDGKVLAGGFFATMGGQSRTHFARLSNDAAALQNLAVTPTTVTWTRGGSSPPFARVAFEFSTDNVNYTPLGNGIPQGGTSNWTLTGLNLPNGQNLYIRARGYFRSGFHNGSGSMTESVRNAYFAGLAPTPTPTQPPSPTATPTPTPAPSATPTPTPPCPLGSGCGGTPTAPPIPSPTPIVQATNFSTRMRVQTGDNVGIGGFIITGTAPKHVLLRAIGPSLTQLGVPDALADPVLELHGSGVIAPITNDNWRDDPAQETAIIATGIPPTNNLESAIDATLNPGAYTAIVSGTGNISGVALVEVYDLSPAILGKLANISTRALVSTGNDIVIAGFILGGQNGADRIVARGIGPSLAAAGVPNPLADPTIELRDSNGALLMGNNDWQDNPAQAAELTAAGLAPTNQLESGVAATLPPGLYTALLAGLNNGTGVGLVEVYDRGPP